MWKSTSDHIAINIDDNDDDDKQVEIQSHLGMIDPSILPRKITDIDKT